MFNSATNCCSMLRMLFVFNTYVYLIRLLVFKIINLNANKCYYYFAKYFSLYLQHHLVTVTIPVRTQVAVDPFSK